MQHLYPMTEKHRFFDRWQAGEQLAVLLAQKLLDSPQFDSPLVLALPRGGVPVGYEIARKLQAPLSVFLVRKLGAPGQPELGVGAIAQGNLKVLNPDLIRMLGITPAQLQQVEDRERQVIEDRLVQYHLKNEPLDVKGRTVILVDDGIATGITAAAAVTALKQLHPAHIILAAPVGSREALAMLSPMVDEVVCPLVPDEFIAVGLWYQHFEQTTDQDVMEILAKSHQPSGRTHP